MLCGLLRNEFCLRGRFRRCWALMIRCDLGFARRKAPTVCLSCVQDVVEWLGLFVSFMNCSSLIRL